MLRRFDSIFTGFLLAFAVNIFTLILGKLFRNNVFIISFFCLSIMTSYAYFSVKSKSKKQKILYCGSFLISEILFFLLFFVSWDSFAGKWFPKEFLGGLHLIFAEIALVIATLYFFIVDFIIFLAKNVQIKHPGKLKLFKQNNILNPNGFSCLLGASFVVGANLIYTVLMLCIRAFSFDGGDIVVTVLCYLVALGFSPVYLSAKRKAKNLLLYRLSIIFFELIFFLMYFGVMSFIYSGNVSLDGFIWDFGLPLIRWGVPLMILSLIAFDVVSEFLMKLIIKRLIQGNKTKNTV